MSISSRNGVISRSSAADLETERLRRLPTLKLVLSQSRFWAVYLTAFLSRSDP